MEKKIFFAEEIEFKFPGKEIGKDEIEEIDDFPGRDDFIEFYITHNGGDFVMGACFFLNLVIALLYMENHISHWRCSLEFV